MLKLRPIDLSSALFFGNAIDLGVNYMLKCKQDKKDMSLLVSKEIFEEAWKTGEVNGATLDLSREGCIKFSKSDYDESLLTDEDKNVLTSNPKISKSWLSMRRKGFLILEAYMEQIIPRIQEVFFVQRYIELKNAQGDAFIGYIDFCARWEDGKVYIFDNKTSSVKYDANAVEKSEQLATYKEALNDELTIDGAGYVVIPKKIRKQKLPLVPIEVMTGEISENLIDKTFLMYDDVLDGIKNGHFPCTPEKCQDAPWGCAYKRYCESGGTDMTGLVYHDSKDKKGKK